jgi:hypothetical protein
MVLTITEIIEHLKFHELFDPATGPFNERLDNLLSLPESSKFMEQIIDAILFTRDIRVGRGLRDLTYSYLFTLQKWQPMKAIFTLYMMVDGQIGSWRDVRSYCELVAKHSTMGQDDMVIKPIIGLYNNQLAKDIKALSIDSSASISFAAKWVPRESKGRKWMFNILVSMWTFINDDYKNIMASAKTEESRALAFSKCKMMYRKMVSGLNKKLDAELPAFPKTKVSETTIVKDPVTSARKMFHHNVPLWKLVKHVVRLQQDEESNCEELATINTLWPANYTNGFGDYYVTIVDVSESMYENGAKPLYEAIGEACLIAPHSCFGNRVIIFSNKPELVELSGCLFSEMINRMITPLLDKSVSSVNDVFQLVLDAIISSKMTAEEASNIKIRLLTNKTIDFESVFQMWAAANLGNPCIVL